MYNFQEQLGYIVFSGMRRSNGTQGLRMIVQSDRHPREVDERVECFLESLDVSLDFFSEEFFLTLTSFVEITNNRYFLARATWKI